MAESLRIVFLSILTLFLISPFNSVLSSYNQTVLTSTVQALRQEPVSGSQPTLVVLVQFSDLQNSTSPSRIENTLYGLNDYYAEDSYGIASFTTTISPLTSQWYSLPKPVEYYSSNTASIDNQLVSDSLQAAYNAGVDFHGFKDAIVVHAGSDEAITHSQTDIHSFTIPGFVFDPSPLNSFEISTSVVSESDPLGVYCHEAGHLLGLPDLYDLTQQIDPVNNFVGYWDIMALGEWNPNTNNPSQPPAGTFPAQHSSWSKIKLGWISNSSIRWVYPGNTATVLLQNLESTTNGLQAVKIPIGVNKDRSLSYYLVEMRAKLGTYDQYLPFPSDYPGAALMIYKVNDSIAGGHGNLVLENAHPGTDLSDAGFGPCSSPCESDNTFSDPSNFVKIIITSTSSTSFNIIVDRTSSPLLLLQVNTPAPGMIVTVDGANATSDQSNELRLPVHLGPHEIYVQSSIPVSLGAGSIQLGLLDSFATWADGDTANPRWISLTTDTVLTATYRVIVEPSFATALAAALVLSVVVAGISINSSRRREPRWNEEVPKPYRSESQTVGATDSSLLPRDNSLGHYTIESHH